MLGWIIFFLGGFFPVGRGAEGGVAVDSLTLRAMVAVYYRANQELSIPLTLPSSLSAETSMTYVEPKWA